MAQKTPPLLMSESLAPGTWDREEIFRLIYEGERSVQPIALQSGAFYHPHGAYQVFETSEGARLGIWAADPDDLVIEDIKLTAQQAEGRFRLDADGNQVPLKEGDVLARRPKDLGNGNIGRLRIFTVKAQYTAERWLREEMGKHQTAYRAFTLEQGTLIRETPTLWTSGGIVYQLLPQKKQIGEETIYDLKMMQAPGFGWRLGADFKRVFNGKRLSPVFSHVSSVCRYGVTLAQAEKIVARDFEKRAQFFVNGKNPYLLPFSRTDFARARKSFWVQAPGTGAGKRKMTRRARLLMREQYGRKLFLRTLYGIQNLSLYETLKTIGVIGFSLAIFGGIMHAMGISVNAFLYAGRLTGRTLTRTGERISEYNRLRQMELNDDKVEAIYDKYAKDWNVRQIWGAKLDPARALDLEAVDIQGLNTDYYNRILPYMPAQLMVKNYILCVLQGPAGSLATPFKCGGIRIDEPNGLSVEYLPERRVAFARLAPGRENGNPLPDAVRAEFEKHPDHPYLKVCHDSRNALVMHALTQEDYMNNMNAIAQAEYPPPHRVPDPQKIRLVPIEVPRKVSFIERVLVRVFGRHAGEAMGKTITDLVEESAEALPDALKLGSPRP